MTYTDKELLLRDLSARLPFGVIVDMLLPYGNDKHRIGKLVGFNDGTSEGVGISFCMKYKNETGIHYNIFGLNSENIPKPFLRPMSSMTEEERTFYNGLMISINLNVSYMSDVVDWLNKEMFDYRGLIPKGLAIAVTEENNPYKD